MRKSADSLRTDCASSSCVRGRKGRDDVDGRSSWTASSPEMGPPPPEGLSSGGRSPVNSCGAGQEGVSADTCSDHGHGASNVTVGCGGCTRLRCSYFEMTDHLCRSIIRIFWSERKRRARHRLALGGGTRAVGVGGDGLYRASQEVGSCREFDITTACRTFGKERPSATIADAVAAAPLSALASATPT